MIKKDEIRQLPLEELKVRLQDAEEELANLKFQSALRQLDNPLSIRYARRDVARLKTVIHEHEMGIRGDEKKAVKE